MNDNGLLASIARAFKGRDGRIAALEARVATLENIRPGTLADAWRGIYDAAEIYRRGDLATRSGALWLSLEDGNVETPGKSPAWKMLSKSHK